MTGSKRPFSQFRTLPTSQPILSARSLCPRLCGFAGFREIGGERVAAFVAENPRARLCFCTLVDFRGQETFQREVRAEWAGKQAPFGVVASATGPHRFGVCDPLLPPRAAFIERWRGLPLAINP